MPKPKVQINPADFSDVQWRELFYCSTLLPGKDDREKCAPFLATAAKVKEAIADLQAKAKRILSGGLDFKIEEADAEYIEAQKLENREWAHTLRAAAKILSGYLADPHLPKYKCPDCGSAERLDIEISVSARLVQDPDNLQTDLDEAAEHDHHWDGDSEIVCRDCGRVGTVDEFDTEKEQDVAEVVNA